MSDKVAEEREQESAEAKKKLEETKKRLWVVQLVRDPDTGNTNVIPVQNVQKQWQLDLMLNQATQQQEMTKQSRVTAELMMNVLKGAGVIKAKGKGIFKGR